jgi:rod shape-determining protein MreD
VNVRQVTLAMVAVVVAVVVQTTLFARVRPFDVAPDIVILTIVACARYIEPEPAVLLGFTGGLFLDLFGTAPLGLQALAFTLVALVAVRTRDRYAYNVVGIGVAVGLLTLLGILLVAIIGTLFGTGRLSDPDILRTLALVPAYNMVLGLAVLPIVGALIGDTRRPESIF